MAYNPTPPANQPPGIVKRFEPARAVLRPRACDERAGCWVKEGLSGLAHRTNRRLSCIACDGTVLEARAKLNRAHAKVLVHCAAGAP